MYRAMRVAVVIPAHNEALLLPVTLSGLPRFVDHVIVVDDASVDRTAQVAKRRGPWRLEVIRHPTNRGVGGAIVTGYRRALALGADAAVVVGADAQMEPSEMSALLDALVEDRADYAKGNRLGHPEVARRMPWVRLVGNHLLSHATRWSSGVRGLRDSQCGYTAIRTDLLPHLPLDSLYQRYGFPNDLIARVAEAGGRVVDLPVTPIYGDERSDLRVVRVVAPISWILLRAAVRRLLGWARRREPLPTALASVQTADG